jgi:hypothetical protein
MPERLNHAIASYFFVWCAETRRLSSGKFARALFTAFVGSDELCMLAWKKLNITPFPLESSLTV